jgi:hypothetical protein
MRYFVLLVALLSTNVSADSYFGGSFGPTSIDIERVNLPGTVETADDTSIGLRIFAGVSLSPNVSVELGYLDAGEYSQHVTDFIDTLSSKITGNIIDISVIGKSDAGLYGRAGLYRASFKGNTYLNGTTILNDTANNSDILFGFGYELISPVLLPNNTRLRFEYTKYLNVGNDDFGETDVDFISVGVVIPIK